MSGIYTVRYPPAAVTTALDLFEITPSSSKPCMLLSIHLGQSTEIGDAQEEQLQVSIKYGQDTTGSGGTLATSRARDISASGVFPGFVAKYGNTTKASGGNIVTLDDYFWNVRMPLDVIFTEAETIIIPASVRLTIELVGTPTDSITLGGYIVVQEIG